MKAFVFILLSATLICAYPTEDSREIFGVPQGGWFVPQINGSLIWMTEEEAEIAERTLAPRLFGQPKVKFFLYTRQNPDSPKELFIDDSENLESSDFNSNHQTRFIIHGWQNNRNSDVNIKIRVALLEVMECNVIVVDWSDKSFSYNYMISKNNVPKVGKKVAEMIDFLAIEGNMSLKDLNVIGHSLGAHVSGFAGKHVTTGQIFTIIGLDPAWPLYTFSRKKNRLCDTDAHYVEVIHTNGGMLGFMNALGKADFYPNGGIWQPGCIWDLSGACSHAKSYLYYAQAIRTNSFRSRRCRNYSFVMLNLCENENKGFVARLGSSDNHNTIEGTFITPVFEDPPYGTEEI